MDLLNIYRKWEQKNNNQFLDLLEFDSDSKVIDIGCGNGEFTFRVKKRIGCKNIFGVDIWKESLKESRKKGIKILKADLNKKLKIPSNCFDVVVSNQVIEHLFCPEIFVKEIYRILKKDGYAIISTENLGSWDNVLALLFGFTPFSMQFNKLKIGNPLSPHDKEHYNNYPSHTRIFTYKGLIDFLKFFGFKIEKIKASGHILPFFSNIDGRHTRFLTLKVRK